MTTGHRLRDAAPSSTDGPRGGIDLIAVDVDGTLRTSEHTVTDRTREALAAFRRRGGVVMVASGRPEHGLRHLAERHGMGLDGMVLSSGNGSTVTQAVTGEVLSSRPLPPEVVALVSREAGSRGLSILAALGDELVTETADGHMVQADARSNDLRVRAVEHLTDVDDPLPKALLSGEPSLLAHHLAELRAAFDGLAETALSTPYFFEVNAPGVDKGSALLDYCRARGIDPVRTMAFGDNENDVPMLVAAGTGVAMGNAPAHVQQVADRVTSSNDEDGIAVVVEELLHG